MPKKIRHDTHKEHELKLCKPEGDRADFHCKGCDCKGAGHRYRCCDGCDFDLHEFCATCPPSAPFFFHGQHPLTLELEPVRADKRLCKLCGMRIHGMHYSCRPCGFDVHPICSQLPSAAVSPLHPQHLVMLAASGPSRCTHCSTDCKLWRYRCSPCRVNLHPRCLLGTDQTPPLCIPRGN